MTINVEAFWLRFSVWIGLGLLVLSVASCAVQPSNDSPSNHTSAIADGRIRLNVCTSSSPVTATVLVYALEKGIFAKYGLDVR